MPLRQVSQSDSFIFILILPLFMKIGECTLQSAVKMIKVHEITAITIIYCGKMTQFDFCQEQEGVEFRIFVTTFECQVQYRLNQGTSRSNLTTLGMICACLDENSLLLVCQCLYFVKILIKSGQLVLQGIGYDLMDWLKSNCVVLPQ